MNTKSVGRPIGVVAVLLVVAGCNPSGPLLSSQSPSPGSPSASASGSAGPTASPVPSGGVVTGPGVWQRGQAMSMPRADFTATTLADGRVLLTGGQTLQAYTATAEIFDPSSNTFSSANSMRTARSGQTATLLASGKVLVIGGTAIQDGPALATADVYDPATNSWSAAASMARPRTHHAALLMPDGRVLVVGGEAPGSQDSPIWEVYDPETNTWSAIQSPQPLPNGATATTLTDGRILINGGWAVVGPYTADFFDPNTAKWSYGSHIIPTPRNWSTAALLANGNVIVVGGLVSGSATGALSSTDVFVPGGDAWIDGPAMRAGHCHHTMSRLKSGALLVAGGRCGTSESIAVSELFDPKTQKWSLAAPLQDAVGFATAVTLRDGRVLVAGGIGAGGGLAMGTQIYTPATS